MDDEDHLEAVKTLALSERSTCVMVFRGTSCVRDDETFARYQGAVKARPPSLGNTA